MQGHVDGANASSSALESLTEEQAERLTDVLDRYLASLEAGQPLPSESLLAGNADLREPLRLYLDKLNELHNFSAGFSPHLAGAATQALFPSGDNALLSGATRRDRPLLTPPNRNADPTTRDSTTRESANSNSVNSSSANGSSANGITANGEAVPPELLDGQWVGEAAGAAGRRRLGDFELIRVVGRGGMGIVYEAEQLSLQRRVALKLLPLTSLLDARQIARFKNEAQAAAALQHPNIVPVYAVGSYQGVHYYAMRLIDGQPLDAIIAALRIKRLRQTQTDEPIEPTAPGTDEPSSSNAEPVIDDLVAAAGWHVPTDMRRVIRLGIEAACALATAHEEGIIHRDVKPSNLLVDRSGKLWITDFGLARRASDHSLTATGDVLGTLRYMSPEQASGRAGLVDARSDIYSLGVTLYELLTLAPAVVGDSSPGLLRAIEQHPPVSLRHLRPDLPRDLVTVLETAMAKSPFERYLTARDFADDLLRVLEGRPTLAKPPSLLTHTLKWAARHHRVVAAAAFVFLFACIGLGAGTWIIAHKSTIAQQNAHKAQKSFNALRDLMERTHTETVEELKDTPGTEVMRRKLLRDLLGYYREFVDEFRSDPTLRADVAMALARLGTLHRDLGQPDAARERLREARALYQSLVAGEPERLEYRRQLAICANQLGRVLAQLGETKAAEASAREAVELQQVLTKAHPDSDVLAADLAESRNELALLLAETGRRQEAEKLLGTAREDLIELTRAAPRELKYQKRLAATYNNLCSVMAGRDPAAAAKLYQLSLDVQKRMLTASAEPLPSGGLMAVTYSNLGKSLVHAGQLNQAIDAYRQAIKIQRQLIEVAPSHREYVRDLGISLNNLGLAQMKQNFLKEAEASFREAIQWQQRLIDQTPNDANAAHDLGGTYNNLATLLQFFPDMQAIDAAFERAIFYQRQAQQAAPAVERYREFLDNHLRNYATWLQNSRREDLALAAALERRILWSGNARQLVLVASDLANAALDIARDSSRKGIAQRYADAAMETLGLAQKAGLAQSHGVSVQQLLSQQPFSSLAQIKSPTD